jgi:hypothetical protein
MISEMFLPQAWSEFGNSRCGVQSDALEYIDEIGIRIDAVQSASDD